jgi:GT2 family glycosyltransferase
MDRTVFVIVLNWNGKDVIAPCLASLAKVSDPPLETIVVDNASSDGSAETVRREFPRVELIVNGRNLLFAEGNNVGIRRAIQRGAGRLLLLNNDTEVDPAFAARMLEALDESPRVGVVGPKILYHDDPKRIWYGGGGFSPLLWVPTHEHIRRIDGSFPERREETQWVSGCAMLVRRTVIDSIGLLDPSYRIYCEDVDFCLRARRAGWACVYEPRAVVRHKVSASSGGGMTPFKLENRLASTARLFRRFKPRAWRLAMAPLHAAAFAAIVLGLLATGRLALLRGALAGASRALRGD